MWRKKKRWKSLGDFQFTFNSHTSVVSLNFRSRNKNEMAEHVLKIIYQHCHYDDIHLSTP